MTDHVDPLVAYTRKKFSGASRRSQADMNSLDHIARKTALAMIGEPGHVREEIIKVALENVARRCAEIAESGWKPGDTHARLVVAQEIREEFKV